MRDVSRSIPRKHRRHHHRRKNILLPTFLSKCTASLLLLITLLLSSSPHNHPNHHALLPLFPPFLAPVSASGILTDLASSTYERIFPPEDYIDLDNDDFETKTLDIVEISNMRGREIKRHLARKHGYDPDELSRMIDKKDLINALSFEEHKVFMQESDRRKWIRFKTTVIYTCAAVLGVLFWPLVRHALEVAHVNFVVYTDRRKYEMKRCREFNTIKGYIGILLLFIIDLLSFWLSTSVLLSWFTRSKYFFPIPQLPIRPAQLLTPKGGDAGALGNYGINVGPMVVSWLFRFLNRKVEEGTASAMASALGARKRKEKDEMKRARKEEKAREKEARRDARRSAGVAREEREKAAAALRRANNGADSTGGDEDGCDSSGSDGESSYVSYSGMTASNVTRSNLGTTDGSRDGDDVMGTSSDFNDLD